MTDDQRMAARMRFEVTDQIPEAFRSFNYLHGEPMICTACGHPAGGNTIYHAGGRFDAIVTALCFCRGAGMILCRP